MLGGKVETVETDGEYGRMAIRTTQASELYREEADHAQCVWMSHGDKAVQLPPGFQPVATSEKVRRCSSAAACMLFSKHAGALVHHSGHAPHLSNTSMHSTAVLIRDN